MSDAEEAGNHRCAFAKGDVRSDDGFAYAVGRDHAKGDEKEPGELARRRETH